MNFSIQHSSCQERSRPSVSFRRNSLISISMFDFSSLPLRSGGCSHYENTDVDLYAPLSIDEGIPLSKSQQPPSNYEHQVRHHMVLSDRSESSDATVPSLCHSSYTSSPNSPASSPYESFRTDQMIPKPMGAMHHKISPLPMKFSSNDDFNEDEDDDGQRFKPFHEEKWSHRYKELVEFQREQAHAAVPHTYPANPQLARWVKRQRRQYKLRLEGKTSTMTAERLELLNSIGFVWDSHDVNWREKLDALVQYACENGHCNVPSNYSDKKLATWVKCQRRQYKLYCNGKASSMTPERIRGLEKVGFEWEIRNANHVQSEDDFVEPIPVDFNNLHTTRY